MDTDPLTGVGSRRFFLDGLARAIEVAQLAGEQFGVFVFDLDHLACFILQHGYLAGDDLLQRVGRAVGALLEPQSAFSRIGGDEFAFLVRGSDLDQVPTTASRVLGAIAGLAVDPYQVLQPAPGDQPAGSAWTEKQVVTASGVVVYHPEHLAVPGDLVELFSAGLVQAKRAGRGGWVKFRREG